jgi:hypothetical protein
MATPRMINISKISELLVVLNSYLNGHVENRIRTTKLKDLLCYMVNVNKQHVSIDDFNQKRTKYSQFSIDDLGFFNKIIEEVDFNGLKCCLVSNRVYFCYETNVEDSDPPKKAKSSLHLVTS